MPSYPLLNNKGRNPDQCPYTWKSQTRWRIPWKLDSPCCWGTPGGEQKQSSTRNFANKILHRFKHLSSEKRIVKCYTVSIECDAFDTHNDSSIQINTSVSRVNKCIIRFYATEQSKIHCKRKITTQLTVLEEDIGPVNCQLHHNLVASSRITNLPTGHRV